MYRYNFECEKIFLEFVSVLVSIKDEEYRVNILITEENILIFKNANEEILNLKGITPVADYVLIVKIKLSDIDYIIHEENTVIKYNNYEIILYDFDLDKVKSSLFSDKNVIY